MSKKSVLILIILCLIICIFPTFCRAENTTDSGGVIWDDDFSTKDDKLYYKDKLFTGLNSENHYYKNGVLATGTYENKYYVNGILANGIYKSKYYKDGILATGTYENKFYKNGKLFRGIDNDKYYQNGILATGIYKTKYYKDGVLGTGIYKNKYYKDGLLFTGIADNKYYKNGILSTGIYENKYYKKGELATGTYQSKYYKDGILATGLYNNKYYKDGVLFTGTVDGKTYKNGVEQKATTNKTSSSSSSTKTTSTSKITITGVDRGPRYSITRTNKDKFVINLTENSKIYSVKLEKIVNGQSTVLLDTKNNKKNKSISISSDKKKITVASSILSSNYIRFKLTAYDSNSISKNYIQAYFDIKKLSTKSSEKGWYGINNSPRLSYSTSKIEIKATDGNGIKDITIKDINNDKAVVSATGSGDSRQIAYDKVTLKNNMYHLLVTTTDNSGMTRTEKIILKTKTTKTSTSSSKKTSSSSSSSSTKTPSSSSSSSSSTSSSSTKVTPMTISAKSYHLKLGYGVQLTATAPSNLSDKSIHWESANTKIAEVNSNGYVTARGIGTTRITATASNGKHLSCTIKVGDDIRNLATSISLKTTNISLTEGSYYGLKATIKPSSATNKTIKWTTGDPKVAKVSNGTIQAVGAGSTTIKATTTNGKSATCKVTVKAKTTPVNQSTCKHNGATYTSTLVNNCTKYTYTKCRTCDKILSKKTQSAHTWKFKNIDNGCNRTYYKVCTKCGHGLKIRSTTIHNKKTSYNKIGCTRTVREYCSKCNHTFSTKNEPYYYCSYEIQRDGTGKNPTRMVCKNCGHIK